MNNDINNLENLEFKKQIENKINREFNSKKYKKELLQNLEQIDKSEDLKKFNNSIEYYIMKYNKKLQEQWNNIFSRDIRISENKENKNEQLLELLLKYSKIKELIEDIFKNNINKYVSFEKFNDFIPPKYQDIFNTLLLKKGNNYNDIIINLAISMFVQDIINKDLVQNLINIKKLLNNLYDFNKSKEIGEIWCKNIGNNYNLETNIYMPKLTKKSFLNLFIKEKNDIPERELGFLLDMNISEKKPDSSMLNKIFTSLQYIVIELSSLEIKDLMLSIGNILVNKLITQNQKEKFECLEKLDNYIKIYLEQNNNYQNKKLNVDILDNFLKAKKLFLEYNNNEEDLQFMI